MKQDAVADLERGDPALRSEMPLHGHEEGCCCHDG
jgi:hypothetical protein